MGRIWLVLGCLSGFVSVAAGAFGAHGLREKIAADLLEHWETAARYEMYHALALVLAGLFASRAPSRAADLAGWAFAAGTILFSGSLYALAFTGARSWGAVTPFGGGALLLGWVALLVAAARRPA